MIYAGMDWLFRHRGWENRQFVAYLKSFDPDIVFASLAKNGMWRPLLACIQNNTHAKIVLNASDDIYGAAKAAAWYRRKKLVQDVEWCIAQADRLYGQSVQICDAYGACFGRVFTPIYKGCTFEKDVSDEVHRPIRIVYAGNLFYGRADSLSRLADVLEKINGDGLHMTLQIYTGADVTPELDRKLNRGRHSRMMGRRSYEEIKDILHDADIVLHVESFEQKQMDDVHYSFSTKIIDCLQSGCAAMGIGPAGIASIEYLRGVPGAVVVDDLKDLERAMTALLLEGDGLLSRAAQTRAFAVEHHDLAETQRKLHRELEALL